MNKLSLFLRVLVCALVVSGTPYTVHGLLSSSREIEIQNSPAKIRIVRATVTAYTSDPAETDDSPFITASNERVRRGIIACPRSIPFGTQVEIEGVIYECQDRMNSRHTNRFDIWMETKQEAFNWGKQTKFVKIYE